MNRRAVFFLLIIISALGYFFTYGWHDKEVITDRAPRVLMTTDSPGGGGGIATYVLSNLSSKLKENYQFGFASPQTSQTYLRVKDLGTAQVYACDFPSSLGRELLPMVKAFFHLKTIIADFKPDIIHTNKGGDHFLVTLATLFSLKRPKIVRTLHDRKILRKDPYHIWNYNICSGFIFVSNGVWQCNLEKGGYSSASSFCVIPHGVDIDYFSPRESDVNIKKNLGIPEDAFIIGSIAGLRGEKRVDIMLEAIASIKDQYPNLYLVVAAPEGSRLQFQNLVESYSLEDRVFNVGLHLDTRPYVSIFDVGFSLGLETLSYASREMLSMGVPLITLNALGLKDNVENYYNGVFIEPDGREVEQVAEALKFFVNMPKNEMLEYKKHARLKAEAEFSIEDNISKLDRVYRNALAGLPNNI